MSEPSDTNADVPGTVSDPLRGIRSVEEVLGSLSFDLGDLIRRLRTNGDRSDPRIETVLCLVECAHETTIAMRAPASRPDDWQASMRNALGAARAAVVCASTALMDARK